jgi:cysteine desulfurase / selenocysteine lyase
MMSKSVSTTTMRTPISDLTPTPEVPSGFPDVATLARMANAFFTALPGAAAAEEGISTLEKSPDNISITDPSAASGVPRRVLGTAPGAASPVPPTPGSAIPNITAPGAPAFSSAIPGTKLPGAPAPGAAISSAPVPPQAPGHPAPTSPFYFLDYAGSGWDALPSAASAALDNLAALAAHPTALPMGVDLSALRAPSAPAAGSFGAVPAPGGLPSFYFLESTPTDVDIRAIQAAGQHPPFNVAAIRRDFPILSERVNGRPLIWLDNAATTQKPQAVIDRLAHFYAHENSNIHRAAHELAARATDAYEGARATVQRFLGASSPEEIVFVRGATEAINLVAQSWGRQNIRAGDEIVISHLEHHANIVPWQQLASEKGARLRVIPVDDSGQILLDEYQKLLGSRTKLVAIAQVSNALGTIVPVREVSDLAHRAGARVLIDGAQAISHMPVNVQALGADFYAFSGHKVFGPTGIGVLYGTAEILESMPPWQGGGNMISSVTFERTTYQKPPARFEAGTGNIADAAGLAAALDYISRLGMANIDRYEHDLLSYATAALQTVPGLRLIGTAREKASVLSFVLAGHDPVAVGKALNEEGIAVRAGHHCAEPILHRFGVTATVRPSLAFYNTCEEVDTLTAALHRLVGQSGRR